MTEWSAGTTPGDEMNFKRVASGCMR